METGPSGWRGTAGLCAASTAALVGGFSRDGTAGSVRGFPTVLNMAACACENVAGQKVLCKKSRCWGAAGLPACCGLRSGKCSQTMRSAKKEGEKKRTPTILACPP